MSSPHLVTEVQRFVDGLAEGNAKPLYEMTPQQARQVLLDAQDVETAKADALIEDMQIPVGDGKSIPVRFVRPHKSPRERLPVVFYIHGGGWVMGDAATLTVWCAICRSGRNALWCFLSIRRLPRLNILRLLMSFSPFSNILSNRRTRLSLILPRSSWPETASAAIWRP